jgi:hypothetical protein
MNRSNIVKRQERMLKLANNLTNEELCSLFNMTSGRFDIYIGRLGNCMISTKTTWACMNGPYIQVNTELSEFDDMRDEFTFGEAFKRLKKTTKSA